ncbi:hypothetical protein [Paraburkholderia adhaesiva]|uniref:hypothetical protein n=1 Tax=Paraburkholderia adhaesiva TaxID=2883244 RepID=UPI001F48A4D3|nr:hypothetical protein [Paraburkholderia adhaesiva]
MCKLPLLVVLTALATVSGVAHAQQPASFEDCPATVQAGRVPPRLVFDAGSRAFRSAVADVSRGPVNFAGHYRLAQWGCGAGCVMAAAIDVKTGRVTSLPFTVSDWPLDVTEPLAYRANSCMLTVQGSRNESKEHGTYWYVFNGKAFHLRSAVPESGR